MASMYVEFETTGVALLARVVPNKVTDREAGVITDEVTEEAKSAANRVVLDLSQVTLLASAGLGSLLSLNKTLKGAKGGLVIFGLNDDILGVMRIARLDKILNIQADREAALAQFR